MGYILAYLRKHGHDGVIIDDLPNRPLSLWSLEEWIQKIRPGVIGFIAYQKTMDRIRFFCRYVKLYHKEIIIVLGGPQAAFMPSIALSELEDVDIICHGEGEIVARDIADCVEANKPFSSINNITFRNDGRIVDSARSFDRTKDLDDYPSPYLDGIINLEGKEEAAILTSRGCKDTCLFCISPAQSERKVSYHSINRVLDEMQYLEKRGVKRFWVGDLNFPASKRDIELLQGKIDRGINAPFFCETRADLLDAQILDKLVEAGCDTIALGLESADQMILKRVAKGIEIERLRQVVEIAKSKGLQVELYSICGLQGETVESALGTLDFFRKCKIPIQSNSGSQKLNLFFGSIYERYKERYGFKPIPGYLPAFLSVGEQYKTKNLSKKDFRKIERNWTLASEDMRRNAHNRQQSFDVLNFLLESEDDLQDEQVFYEYGAMASSALEERELLLRFLNNYVNRLHPSESVLRSLISGLGIYKETHSPATQKSRVILDIQSLY